MRPSREMEQSYPPIGEWTALFLYPQRAKTWPPCQVNLEIPMQ